MKKVRILMYNNVGSYPDAAMEDALSADAFARDMKWLAENGYRIVSLTEALALANGRATIPDKLMALTFDGGFTDAYEHVFPVLREHGFPATFFVSLPDIGASLNVYGVQVPCMDQGSINEIAKAGFDIGAYVLSGKTYNPDMENELITAIQNAVDCFPETQGSPLRFISVREGLPGKAVMDLLQAAGIEAFLTKCPTKRRAHRYAIGRVQIDDEDPNIFRVKISKNYLRFKDSRFWRYLRKYKVDRLAHLISDTINEHRAKKSSA